MAYRQVSKSKPKRRKLKPGKAEQGLAMADRIRCKSTVETSRRHYCDGCGKRFSERDMFWSDINNDWLCAKCQRKVE